MLLHDAGRDLEPLADALVGATLGDQLEHLALARRQGAQRPVVTVGREQLGDDVRVERRAAGRHVAQRGGEVLDVHDAVLEQVAEAHRALGEHAHRDARLDVGGEDHDRRGGGGGADLGGGPAGPVGGGGGGAGGGGRGVGAGG